MTDLTDELAAVGAARFTARDYRPGRVLHIVLFQYLPDVGADARAEVARRFHALAGSGRILSIESGAQASGEVAAGGYEDGFVVTFASMGDRNYYVGEPVVTDPEYFDPEHAAFKAFAGPLLARVEVFDFAV